ncbi:MAG TPA: hypothetical protein VKB18_00475 [Gemmatimonadota bacterium]|nr:hypothetical protein [Gemmatimonadota bacterium]
MASHDLSLRAVPLLALLLAACSGAMASSDPSPSVVVNSGSRGEATAHTLGIPPGHLPPPGSCRVWMPGEPPGHQPPSGDCSRLASRVPPGAWLLYRPATAGRGRGHAKKDKRVVRVTVYGDAGPTILRVFDVATGRLLSEESTR